MDKSTENFWAALEATEFVPPQIFYRLYYDDNGLPLVYTMEQLPGNYIDIDHKIYEEASMNVRVVNGEIIKLEIKIQALTKLYISDRGTPCALNDVSIVVKETDPHIKWRLECRT